VICLLLVARCSLLVLDVVGVACMFASFSIFSNLTVGTDFQHSTDSNLNFLPQFQLCPTIFF